MKVAIDVQTTQGEKTGFGFYVENLVKNFAKFRDIDFELIKPKKSEDLNAPKRFLWDQFGFPGEALKNNAEIIHQPCFSAPVFHKNAKVIVTVHDLISTKFGIDLPFFARLYFKNWMPYTYKFADKIICDSENTKRDVLEILKVPESKIKVIYLAASDKFNNAVEKENTKQIKDKYNTGDKYFLEVGTLSPRKNIEFLIKVFSRISRDYPEYKLVLTGKKGWYYDKLTDLVKTSGIDDKVIFTGYIPDQDAPYLYKGAELFLYPSLYEGFGLPLLEAMASGVPVISSNASSLPEIVGDGGILIDPSNEAGWIAAVKKVLDNQSLRRVMIQKGLKQAKKFSWKKCADETIKCYEELYDEENI